VGRYRPALNGDMTEHVYAPLTVPRGSEDPLHAIPGGAATAAVWKAAALHRSRSAAESAR